MHARLQGLKHFHQVGGRHHLVVWRPFNRRGRNLVSERFSSDRENVAPASVVSDARRGTWKLCCTILTVTKQTNTLLAERWCSSVLTCHCRMIQDKPGLRNESRGHLWASRNKVPAKCWQEASESNQAFWNDNLFVSHWMKEAPSTSTGVRFWLHVILQMHPKNTDLPLLLWCAVDVHRCTSTPPNARLHLQSDFLNWRFYILQNITEK